MLAEARVFIEQHKEWGCYVLSYQLHNERNIFLSPSSIWRYFYSKKEKEIPLQFYEMKKPHSMWHGDVMEKKLADGKTIYQCTIEDDYSRGYAGVIAEYKDARIVIHALINAIIRWKCIPACFHYDNGSEVKSGLTQLFLKNLSKVCGKEIKFIPTLVENPKGNGKKERAHRDDKRDFWNKLEISDLAGIRKKFRRYLTWRNNKKGHFALNGKPSISRLKENKKQKIEFTKEFLEGVAKFKIGERKVKVGGMIFFNRKTIFVNKNMKGKQVELWETLKGLEIIFDKKVIGFVRYYWEKIKKKKLVM